LIRLNFWVEMAHSVLNQTSIDQTG
jgi:hypothetical protein